MAPLAGELREHRLASPFSRDSDLVFCASSSGTIGHRNLSSRGLTRASDRAGLEGVTFHVLRHTFASILIDQGHDVVFVSRQLGHANPAITLKVYAHLFDAERHADEARARLRLTTDRCSDATERQRWVVRSSAREPGRTSRGRLRPSVPRRSKAARRPVGGVGKPSAPYSLL
jgi:hypothetical protein